MDMLILTVLCAAILVAVIVDIVLTVKRSAPIDAEKLKKDLLGEISVQQAAAVASAKGEIIGEVRASRTELNTTVQNTMKNFSDSLTTAQLQSAEQLKTDVAARMLL